MSAQCSLGSGATLFLGGARSGKSNLVVSLARQWVGPVVFVATAEGHDADMAARIQAHQKDRPDSWDLRELPQLTGDDVATLPDGALVIVDCLTLLVSNLMLNEDSETSILKQVDGLGVAVADRPAPTLIVSNEVGLGVHPATEMGTKYRDILGSANQVVASHTNEVFLVFAGRVLPLGDLQLVQNRDESRNL